MKIAKLLLITLVTLFAFAATQVSAQKEPDQVERGKKLFMNYCASCHGVDAKGKGPVASSLKKQPTDLTRLQKGPKFPTSEITGKISGTLLTPVHGKRDMPVWGLIFSPQDITNLVKYLESIQRLYEPQPAG